ncbi:GNAT family N-acetyltransferase [Roseofilum reptotaenium CS-1145]|uniref:GNAT family N-acetyltransferase n=1 Tax=Roseofilum reptotaenium AO1-A TaxID=1925591 RepID=A0A1L9QUG6_9CYAN|nr:GNAT family N-acetyltransferase [Roseofilum reptotaenium]MDB9517743.1 GNAT family N-acetyltransferase [Roseofilum reptotaenium CS-1145]OJJ26311.1 GNAT family N-acetyltransferase [Roseofilum reptotaenium AO1-A]
MIIRPLEQADWPATWQIIEPVFRAGETYSVATHITEEEAFKVWVEMPVVTCVAENSDGLIQGTYYLKVNQPGPGSHVCNSGYIVAEAARGKGIASALFKHSQTEAVRLGFRAMQYNFVVSTNTVAVRLWRKLGFEIVGTLPEACLHPSQGFVDVYVMYKKLDLSSNSMTNSL